MSHFTVLSSTRKMANTENSNFSLTRLYETFQKWWQYSFKVTLCFIWSEDNMTRKSRCPINLFKKLLIHQYHSCMIQTHLTFIWWKKSRSGYVRDKSGGGDWVISPQTTHTAVQMNNFNQEYKSVTQLYTYFQVRHQNTDVTGFNGSSWTQVASELAPNTTNYWNLSVDSGALIIIQPSRSQRVTETRLRIMMTDWRRVPAEINQVAGCWAVCPFRTGWRRNIFQIPIYIILSAVYISSKGHKWMPRYQQYHVKFS